MRCYHLCNMYLSSIQQGIQSAHSQMELFVKYQDDSFPEKGILYDWAENHKTMIVLNGGFLSDMEEALEFLNDSDNPYPFVEFYESDEAMGGMMTNIAIVLPDKIYETASLIRQRLIDSNLDVGENLSFDVSDDVESTLAEFGEFTDYEIELCSFMNQFRLAS